ncbi:dual oxidase 1-like [Sycon ciliatum]|uniref:dual oxidase 1-like n=1 Tax=Sycon ciliatum TaxID=27933 RepID=UPI0031F6B0A0
MLCYRPLLVALASLALFHVSVCIASNTSRTPRGQYYHLPEVEGYDGWYNNPSHPEWGSADSPLSRRIWPAYSDGTYQPNGQGRPNPHDVATACLQGPKGLKSYRNRTALLTFYGQQIVEEILDAQRAGCPPEYHNIPIPKCHALFDPECKGNKEVPFLRSRYDKSTGQSPNNPRKQLNEATPWIDGGLFYGPNKAWADALRSFTNGTLACSDSTCRFPAKNKVGLPFANPPPPADHVLKSSSRFFKIGNPRGNENPMLLSLGITWFRNHNWHANRLRKEFDAQGIKYKDETLFNRARQWNIADQQKISLNDWLPAFLGRNITPYTGYKSTRFVNIGHMFQTSAMRFGHTLVPPVVYRASVRNSKSRDWQCVFRQLSRKKDPTKSSAFRTCQSYWNSPDHLSEDNGDAVDELLLGMSKQVCEREDNIVTEDLRGFVFGSLDFSRRDLMALNIQRARDHGIPDYNTVRASFGLPRIRSFAEINNSTDKFIRAAIRNLSRLYNNDVNNIDLWPAGLLETTPQGPGPTFAAIISDQFEGIRDADRFWFENKDNGLFTDEEIEVIRKTTFRTILSRNIKASWFREDLLQKDVFHFNADVDDSERRCRTEFEQYNDATLTAEIDACSPMKTFDYFSGSGGPYITTIIGIAVYFILNVAVLIVSVKYVSKSRSSGKPKRKQSGPASDFWSNAGVFTAQNGEPLTGELVKSDTVMSVSLGPIIASRQLKVYNTTLGGVERTIDLTGVSTVNIEECHDVTGNNTSGLLCMRMAHRYDLAMRVDTHLQHMISNIAVFCESLNIQVSRKVVFSSKQLLWSVVTKKDRHNVVQSFFRALFKQTSGADASKGATQFIKKQRAKKREALSTELTRPEFAEAMGMKPTSIFVEQVFRFVDTDKSYTVSFQEFFQFLAVFTQGSSDTKMELMFAIYDIDGDGVLSHDDFSTMLGHLAEQAGETIGKEKLDSILSNMLKTSKSTDSMGMTLEEFKTIFGEYKEVMGDTTVQLKHAKSAVKNLRNQGVNNSKSVQISKNSAQFGLGGSHQSTIRGKSSTTSFRNHYTPAEKSDGLQVKETSMPGEQLDNLSPFQHQVLYVQRLWENYRFHIFWLTLYLLVVLCIFAERAYYYSVEREHVGLRRIAGYGVTVTRGAASAMMFTYSSILVTMCRNLLTKLRETPLNRYIPFDAAHSAHKVIACVALFFTVMHILGHCINFYHISTQTANDLTCLFREYYHFSHELPKFQFWMFSTLTGITGLLLTFVVVTIYIFALPQARRYLFNTFWIVHRLYIVLFILLILHGSGRLVQPPLFQWFFIVPAALFVVDKLISLKHKKHDIPVFKAEKLPSGVTHLQFKKPKNFNYLSGQWCRISSRALNSGEYHPFTLTSAPHEETLDLYIRAVGPWTENIRQIYDPENPKNQNTENKGLTFPRIYLDGPFGEGHQDWYKYDIAVLVGGGIGVTPFASILKDLVCKKQSKVQIPCKKVYFFWVTKTQKQFEWLTEIIKQVEQQDDQKFTGIHIFITQFYQKFDIRTIMLYICERHFQKISKQSLFTGLKSTVHFGRPQFDKMFDSLQDIHDDVAQIGTFSCGPPPMTRSVEAACVAANQNEGPVFFHHYENF